MKPDRLVLFACVTSVVAALLAGASLARRAPSSPEVTAPSSVEPDASLDGYAPVHHGPLGAPVPLYPPTEAGLVPISGAAPTFAVYWGQFAAATGAIVPTTINTTAMPYIATDAGCPAGAIALSVIDGGVGLPTVTDGGVGVCVFSCPVSFVPPGRPATWTGVSTEVITIAGYTQPPSHTTYCTGTIVISEFVIDGGIAGSGQNNTQNTNPSYAVSNSSNPMVINLSWSPDSGLDPDGGNYCGGLYAPLLVDGGILTIAGLPWSAGLAQDASSYDYTCTYFQAGASLP